MPSFFFHELQLITVLLLICDSYMSSSTRFVSPKLCVGFSIFNSVSFLLKFYFCLTKCMHSLTLNRHNSFQNSFKSHRQFCFQTSDFQVATRSFKFNVIYVSRSFPKTDLVINFLNPKNRRFENVSIVTFKYLTFLYLITY